MGPSAASGLRGAERRCKAPAARLALGMEMAPRPPTRILLGTTPRYARERDRQGQIFEKRHVDIFSHHFAVRKGSVDCYFVLTRFFRLRFRARSARFGLAGGINL